MRSLIICALLLAIAGCDNSTRETAETQIQKADHGSINWYKGSVEQAFADAKDSKSPVFLYWGAVWCPPCQEIRNTVFKSDSFINMTRQFVPVYLDGDTDRAQAWGEKFGVAGYPTMIIFNPAGDEITRIPGGIDISRYNAVLQLSLNQMRPTSSLVEYALNDINKLSADDFYQLAYYSWGQDHAAVPEGTDEAAMFYRLFEHAPEGELSARFYMWYVLTLADENEPVEDGTEPELSVQAGDNPYEQLKTLLVSDELILACWDSLSYYAEEILALPVFSEEQRDELAKLWSLQVFSLRADESLSRAERLAGWLPRLYMETKDDQALSAELAEQLRSELMRADIETPDSHERQSVINQMSYIYHQAGLKDDAKALLLAELEKSASPYYFMSGLASFAESDDNYPEAIEWRRKAYETATGEATRFQWGANYVRALIRMTPEDTETITSASIRLLNEFHASSEMFAGRNFRILRRLNEQLATWQESGEVADFAFRSRLETLCQEQQEGSLEQDNCRSLSPAESVAQVF